MRLAARIAAWQLSLTFFVALLALFGPYLLLPVDPRAFMVGLSGYTVVSCLVFFAGITWLERNPQ